MRKLLGLLVLVASCADGGGGPPDGVYSHLEWSGDCGSSSPDRLQVDGADVHWSWSDGSRLPLDDHGTVVDDCVHAIASVTGWSYSICSDGDGVLAHFDLDGGARCDMAATR